RASFLKYKKYPVWTPLRLLIKHSLIPATPTPNCLSNQTNKPTFPLNPTNNSNKMTEIILSILAATVAVTVVSAIPFAKRGDHHENYYHPSYGYDYYHGPEYVKNYDKYYDDHYKNHYYDKYYDHKSVDYNYNKEDDHLYEESYDHDKDVNYAKEAKKLYKHGDKYKYEADPYKHDYYYDHYYSPYHYSPYHYYPYYDYTPEEVSHHIFFPSRNACTCFDFNRAPTLPHLHEARRLQGEEVRSRCHQCVLQL
ncbi:hypothetical protein BC938DRAFT_476922, partial [Jimgerdemannia flammicorona]